MIVHVAVAVSHCCSVRAGSDCNTVVEVLCAEWLRWTLLLAVMGGVCNAAPPLHDTTVLTSMLSV